MTLKVRLISIVIIALMSSNTIADTRETELRRTALVAAFVYSFSKFVTWPEEVFLADKNLINLCVLDTEDKLEVWKNYGGKKTQGRRLNIITLASQVKSANCHVIYVSEAHDTLYKQRIARLLTKTVLTIGATENFLHQGGMINLRNANNKINFSINLFSVKSSVLKIHSRLLSLAERLYDGNERH